MQKRIKGIKKISFLVGIIVLLLLITLLPYKKTYAADTIEAPKNLSLYNPEVDTIYLRWEAVTGAEQYYVYISTSKTSGYELVCGLNSNKLKITGLKDDTTYYFKVYAYGNGGVSNSSNIISGKKNVRGIDVSYHNGIIDWNQVKNSGLVDFAILRCGYGDNVKDKNGSYYQDDIKFVYNMQECSKLEIPMGVYLYSYALNTAQAQSEADHVLRMIAGHKFEYKIWYDLEDAATTGTLGANIIGDIAQTFCKSISNAGFDVGIYANKYWFTSILTDSRFNNWPKWVAQYNDVCTYDGVYIMWQYASDGTIPGVQGRVDVNYAFTGVYADLSNVMTYDVSGGLQHELPTPGNIRTTIVNKNKVILTWNKSECSEKYIIYRSNNENSGFQKIAETTSTAFTDSELPSGVSYYYKVRAYSSLATSEYSNVARAKLFVNAPSALKAEVKSYNSIKLTWAASSDATGYEIYRCQTSNGTFNKIATTANTYYTNAEISTGQRYYYKVRAIKDINSGLLKSNGEVNNLNSLFTNVVDAKPILDIPSNVQAAPSGYNTIKITYSAVNNATAYEIYRSISKNGTYRLIKTTTSTTFYNTNLTTGFTYFYKVKAIRKQGTTISKSEFSEKVWRAPKLGIVNSLKVASNNSRTVDASWTSVNGASGYMVYRCSTANGTYTKAGQTTSCYYLDNNRQAGKTYYYKVRAYRYVNNKLKYGTWSSVKKVTVK